MQRYAPEIERGQKKAARLHAGAAYRDTLHRTVKQLHEELPQEKAALEAEIETMSKELIEQEASLGKTRGHLAKLEAKAAVAESMRQLELRQRRAAEIRKEKARVEAEQQEARTQAGGCAGGEGSV